MVDKSYPRSLDDGENLVGDSLDVERLYNRNSGAYARLSLDGTTILATGRDGTIDSGSDADPIIAAVLDDLAAAGGRLDIAEGEYTHGDTVLIDRDNVTLSGQGYGFWGGFNSGNPGTGDEGDGITKLKNSSTNAGIKLDGSGERTKGISLRDLYLYGNAQNGAGIWINDNSDQPVIERVFVHNYDIGVDILADAPHIKTVTLMDLGGNGMVIRSTGGQPKISDCTIYDNGARGIYDLGCDRPKILNTDFGRNDIGIDSASDYATILGCEFTQHRSQSLIIKGDHSVVAGCPIDNNAGIGTGTSIVELQGATNTTIAHCPIENTAGANNVEAAIKLDANCTDCELWGISISGDAYDTGLVVDNGTRTRWNGVIGGGPLGGVVASTVTGASTGDVLVHSGATDANAFEGETYYLKANGDWQSRADSARSFTPA